MQVTDLIPLLKSRFQSPLPGKVAQNKMAVSGRKTYIPSVPTNFRVACVLCLIYPKNSEWHLVLIERMTTEKDRHSGQMSFPGGKYESSDGTYENGALREAREEIGINPEDVIILGEMTSLYIPVSNFQVYPFAGILDYAPVFKPQEKEVQEVVEVPLTLLLAEETRQRKALTIRNKYVLKDVPYFNVKNKIVWGATAMMLSEFIEIVGEYFEIYKP